jgi:hypothetical protein
MIKLLKATNKLKEVKFWDQLNFKTLSANKESNFYVEGFFNDIDLQS